MQTTDKKARHFQQMLPVCFAHAKEKRASCKGDVSAVGDVWRLRFFLSPLSRREISRKVMGNQRDDGADTDVLIHNISAEPLRRSW